MVVESGKEFIKGFGGFLDKAASGIDKNLSKSNVSGSNKNINKTLKKRRENGFISPGYLVCDTCDGYYRLQPEETPDDFINVCECGGKLKYSKNHYLKKII